MRQEGNLKRLRTIIDEQLHEVGVMRKSPDEFWNSDQHSSDIQACCRLDLADEATEQSSQVGNLLEDVRNFMATHSGVGSPRPGRSVAVPAYAPTVNEREGEFARRLYLEATIATDADVAWFREAMGHFIIIDRVWDYLTAVTNQLFSFDDPDRAVLQASVQPASIRERRFTIDDAGNPKCVYTVTGNPDEPDITVEHLLSSQISLNLHADQNVVTTGNDAFVCTPFKLCDIDSYFFHVSAKAVSSAAIYGYCSSPPRSGTVTAEALRVANEMSIRSCYSVRDVLVCLLTGRLPAKEPVEHYELYTITPKRDAKSQHVISWGSRTTDCPLAYGPTWLRIDPYVSPKRTFEFFRTLRSELYGRDHNLEKISHENLERIRAMMAMTVNRHLRKTERVTWKAVLEFFRAHPYGGPASEKANSAPARSVRSSGNRGEYPARLRAVFDKVIGTLMPPVTTNSGTDGDSSEKP